MMKTLKTATTFALAILIGIFPVDSIHAWSECGHHIIAALAYQMLEPSDQQVLIEIIKAHPQFDTEFRIPEQITDASHARSWIAGRAGYWPDVARSYKEFNRPSWHYQLGSAMVLGNVSSINVPRSPGSYPSDATFDMMDMHIAQAISFCRASLSNPKTTPAERALAVSWLAHLVADAHQPCHAGSLYAEQKFPEGDRGANSIPTIQRRNLHALWDGLLGDRLDMADVRRRMNEITSDQDLVKHGEQAIAMEDGLDPETWLRESRTYAVKHVYKPEVIAPIIKAIESHQKDLVPIQLSNEYLKEAGSISQQRAIEAAYRLKAVWKEGLDSSR